MEENQMRSHILSTSACLLALLVGCTKAPRPTATTFSDVCVAVEPGLGRVRLPNVTDHKYNAELKVAGGDFFSVLDVTVEDKGDDREFGFTVMHSIGGEQKGFSEIVRYSELPKKYLQVDKWTVWVKREDQLK